MIDLGLPLATVALAILMVSKVRYPHLVNQMFRGRRDFAFVVKLLFGFVTVALLREMLLPLLVWMFALGTPLVGMFGRIKQLIKDRQPSNIENV
jgi:CDP-diacylglycerol---serine O-phosphatidyltransferase